MEAFLSQTKKELSELASFSKINIVLGNESCDLDSAVSAIVYAFYLSQKEDSPQKPCIPCLNINREDLALRTETVHYLEKNNINLNHLTCRDQINLGELHRDDRLNLYLVDHNTLPGKDSEIEGAVVKVLDHHQSNLVGDDAPDGVIELVGSCCTLVAEHLLQEDPNWVLQNVDETIASLLIGTILFDTVNLSESAGRATPKDINMVENLQKFCPDINQEEIYQEIHDAKFDVAGLSTFDLLRKDFKTVSSRGADNAKQTIGISSITIEMEKILKRPDMRDDFASFCTSRNLQILILMTISIDSDGNAERWLLLYNPGSSICQELISNLKDDQQLFLSIMNDEEEGITLFKQQNSKVSRKVVMPVLQEFLDKKKSNEADFLTGNFNNSALVDFSGGDVASSNLLDFDPFGSPATTSFETQKVEEVNTDPFGGLDLLAGGSLESGQKSSDFSFDPFATIVEDDPSFTTPKSPLSPSGQDGFTDLLGLDPFGVPQQPQSSSGSFDPFQTISPSSDSFNSQEDLLGAPPASADPFDLFSKPTNQDSTLQSAYPTDLFNNGLSTADPFSVASNPVESSSEEVSNNSTKFSGVFDLLGGQSDAVMGGKSDQTLQTTDNSKLSEDNGSFNSFEFVDKLDCLEENNQDLPVSYIPKHVPPTPQNSYSDMSELQKSASNKDFDHDELFKMVQKLDSPSDDNIIVITSNTSHPDSWEENGFENDSNAINGLEDVKQKSFNTDENTALYNSKNSNSNQQDRSPTSDKSSPIENVDSPIGANKSRTTSCGSEGSASFTDDISDSSSGDSYSLNEIPQYAVHHAITEIQEEDEEEVEEDNVNIDDKTNISKSTMDIVPNINEPLMQPVIQNGVEENHGQDGQTLIPAIIIDEVQKRRNSVEEVEVPYIVVEEVETMNFDDDDDDDDKEEESAVKHPPTQHKEEVTYDASEETPASQIRNNDSQTETSSHVLERVDSEAVEEYVEQVVGDAINTINMEEGAVNGQFNNDHDIQTDTSSARLQRIDSEAVEEYVGHVVETSVNALMQEASKQIEQPESEHFNSHLPTDRNQGIVDDVVTGSSPVLERNDSEAVELFVEHVVEAALGTMKTERSIADEQVQHEEHNSAAGSDIISMETRYNPEREDLEDERVIEVVETASTESPVNSQPVIIQSDQVMPSDSVEASDVNQESPSENKKVLELSMDLDMDEEDNDSDVESRERSSSAVNVIEEMAAAAANLNKEPPKRPTELQDGVLSIDDSYSSPVSGLSFDALTPDEEVDIVGTLESSVPHESTPKKPVVVDDDVKQKISFDWNEDSDIFAKAEERQKMKEQEDVRPKTLDKTLSEASFSAKIRMSGVSINEEWQDDDYSHQKLQGQSGTLTSQDSFFERTVPMMESNIEEEEQLDDKIVALDGATLRADYSLRERRLTTDSAVLDAAYPVDEDDDDEEDDAGEDDTTDSAFAERPVPPSSLNVGGARPKHRKKVNIPAGLNLDMEAAGDEQSPATNDSAILTPSSTEMSWEDETPISSKAATPNIPQEPIPEYTAKEEFNDRHNWRKVSIGGKEHSIDMNVINPYRKVLSHGGYYGDGLNAIIVFASCYMPDKTRRDYNYVMDNLFLYIVSTLELLVAQDYMIVYFHGAASRRKVPGMAWMRRCYKLIDRRLRKNLKGLYIVHPTMWLKTVVGFTKPFISSKFSSKLKFVYQLDELKQLVPMEYIYVPEEVRKFDLKRTQKGG
ncbi:protein prune homolog 2-like isoform X2 [Anneissia japonica]|uniref:protein prune homolog 2-like isoform X2 n=1 Tax=Anneissia japonica TaxID=1529436 RepID=UPI0014255257|nr:protein prune homolog 2-like isoform X2 [Anneissia japonica]